MPSNDLEEADGEEQPSPSLLNDELRQEMRARQAKMHRYRCLCTTHLRSAFMLLQVPASLVGTTVMTGTC